MVTEQALIGQNSAVYTTLLALSQLPACTCCFCLCRTIGQPVCCRQSAWRLPDASIGFNQVTVADKQCFLIDLLAALLA